MQYRLSFSHLIPLTILLLFSVVLPDRVNAQQKNPVNNNKQQADSTQRDSLLNLHYPLPKFRQFPSNLSAAESPLFLKDPKNLSTIIEYDPEHNDYKFQEKLGGKNFGYPYYMSQKDYLKYDLNKSVKDYWKQRVGGEQFQSQGGLIPKLYIGGEAFDRIFGSNVISIKPQGSAELIFGVQINKTDNPALPEKVRKNTTFDFDNKIQMNVNGQIGDKLELGITYNTEATFDFVRWRPGTSTCPFPDR
jgi:hypothetical protein